MKSKIEKLRGFLQAKKERDIAEAREKARRRMVKGAALSRLIRNADTRTKILAGSWALDKAEKSEEFRTMMMRDLDRVWLSRDDDRELFGFELLTDDEKARRDLSAGKPGRKKEKHGDASAPRLDSSADASATGEMPQHRIDERETEAA